MIINLYLIVHLIYSEHLYMRKCKSKVKEQNYKVNYYVNERKEYYYENSFEEELRAKVQSVIINADTYIDFVNEVNKSILFIPYDYSTIFTIYETSKEVNNHNEFVLFRDLSDDYEQVNVEIKCKNNNKKRRNSFDEKTLVSSLKLEEYNNSLLDKKFSTVKEKINKKETERKQIKLFQTYKVNNEKGRANKLFKVQSYTVHTIENKFELNNECPIHYNNYCITNRPYTFKELCLLIESHLLVPIKYDLLFRGLQLKEDTKYREYCMKEKGQIVVTIRKTYEKPKKRRNSINSYSIKNTKLNAFKLSIEEVKKQIIDKYDEKIELRKAKKILLEGYTKSLRPINRKLVTVAPVRVHQIPGKVKKNK